MFLVVTKAARQLASFALAQHRGSSRLLPRAELPAVAGTLIRLTDEPRDDQHPDDDRGGLERVREVDAHSTVSLSLGTPRTDAAVAFSSLIVQLLSSSVTGQLS